MAILRRLGANGNAQQIYELCFILWALSLVISTPSRNGEEVELKEFLSTGAVQALAELLVSSPTKKVACAKYLFYGGEMKLLLFGMIVTRFLAW